VANNPYTPPNSPVGDVAPEKGSPAKAVILGVVVDVGGSFAAGMLLTTVYIAVEMSRGSSEAEVAAALTTLSPYSWFGLTGMGLGCLLSVLAGYVCARIAKKDEYGLGAIVAAISVVVALLTGAQQFSAVFNGVLAVLTGASVMIGVRLGFAKNRE
jgi:hypothetical protein